jgi:hypothetical protein
VRVMDTLAELKAPPAPSWAWAAPRHESSPAIKNATVSPFAISEPEKEMVVAVAV